MCGRWTSLRHAHLAVLYHLNAIREFFFSFSPSQSPGNYALALRAVLGGGLSTEGPVRKLLLFLADAIKGFFRAPPVSILSVLTDSQCLVFVCCSRPRFPASIGRE